MNPYVSLSIVIGLALLHAFAGKLPLLDRIPVRYWVSGAGGVAISYIFLEIFPQLVEVQEKLENVEIGFEIENHIYIISLLGLIFFYGLDKLAKSLARPDQHDNPYFFWVHITSFAINNALLGYLLQDSVRHETLMECLVLFFSIGLHFLVIDRGLRNHHSANYDRFGRWILAGAIVTGATIRFSSMVNEVVIAIVWGLVAGGIILNVLKEELPEEKDSSFTVFASSAIGYALILVFGLPK